MTSSSAIGAGIMCQAHVRPTGPVWMCRRAVGAALDDDVPCVLASRPVASLNTIMAAPMVRRRVSQPVILPDAVLV